MKDFLELLKDSILAFIGVLLGLALGAALGVFIYNIISFFRG